MVNTIIIIMRINSFSYPIQWGHNIKICSNFMPVSTDLAISYHIICIGSMDNHLEEYETTYQNKTYKQDRHFFIYIKHDNIIKEIT